MGLIATDVNQTVEFSLASDQGDDRTVFVLRPLDIRERSFLTCRFAPGMRIKGKDEDGKTVSDIGIVTPETVVDSTIWAVRLGLRGWRNFLTASGMPVEVKMESVSVPGIGMRTVLTEESVLMNFRKAWVDEIGAEIIRLSELQGEQRKN